MKHLVAQIFGGTPERFEEIGPLIRELGFDGIDINAGCPDIMTLDEVKERAKLMEAEDVASVERTIGDFCIKCRHRR